MPNSFDPILTAGSQAKVPGIIDVRGPNIKLAPLVQNALRATSAHFNDKADATDNKNLIKEVLDRINSEGLTATISEVTSKLNRAGLDSEERMLASEKTIYAYLIRYALDIEGVSGNNVLGIYNSVVRNLNAVDIEDSDKRDGQPRAKFYEFLVRAYLVEHRVSLDLVESFFVNAVRKGVSIQDGRAEPALDRIFEEIREAGSFPEYVDRFFAKGEFATDGLTVSIKEAMVAYLRKLKLTIDDTNFDQGAYDEYFALAYDHALRIADGREDPIDNVQTKGRVTEWDFTVDTFDSIEDQGIIPENIRAAGALDYIYELGERMGIFKLTDTLILRWARGLIDIPQGETASKLYRYFQLGDRRASPQELGMETKRVLGKSNGEYGLLANTVVNTQFPLLWMKLLKLATDHIRKTEESSNNEQVSRLPIYQATKELQHNLTTYATGMVHMRVTEKYAQLQEAIEILSAKEIVDHFAGGARKNMWTVIEKLAKDEFNQTPNITAIREAAIKGNKVFQWIADFDQASVTEVQFQDFLHAAEPYIIAKSEDESGQIAGGDENFDDDFEGNGFDDEFDDFEDF